VSASWLPTTVPRDAQARRAERPVHLLEEVREVATRDRAAGTSAVRRLLRRVAGPVGRAATVRVVVAPAAADALVDPSSLRRAAPRPARVGPDDAAVEDVDEPARLVPLRVVGVVARDHDELGPLGAHGPHLFAEHEGQQSFLRAVGGDERLAELVDELDPQR
jgi:hypothetical protein